MREDLQKAKDLLAQQEYTCVCCKDGEVLTFTEKGLRPLMKLLQEGRDLRGWSAADKVVGKAPSLLYALLEPEVVYAPVMSRQAVEVLQAHSIAVSYDILTDGILNRAGTGPCPMEAAVQAVDDPSAALEVLRDRIAQMQKKV